MSAAGESVVTQIGPRIDVLSTRMDALNGRMDALNGRIEALNARIDALAESTNARIDVLATIVARMDTRLERFENQQSRLIWGVLGLQAALVVALVTLVLQG